MKIAYLTQYSHVFQDNPSSLAQVIGGVADIDLFLACSYVCLFGNSVAVKSWCANNMVMKRGGKEHCKQTTLVKRPNTLILWKELLLKVSAVLPYKRRPLQRRLEMIVRSLAYINDNEDIGENPEHYLTNNALFTRRDNSLYQFFRSSKIFLEGPQDAPWMKDFEEKFGVSVVAYVYICHAINVYYSKINDKALPSDSSSVMINVDKFTKISGFRRSDISSVLNAISFSFQEGKDWFEKDCRHGENEFNLFFNKPFCRVDDENFVPVDMALMENLVFHNVFHKIKGAARQKRHFMVDYGRRFESYIAFLTEFACKNSLSFSYSYVPEFSYGSPRKLSSDAYILFKDEKANADCVMVVEAKSARILNRVLGSDNDSEAISLSLQKLWQLPFNQQVRSVSQIIKEKANREISIDKVFYFVTVTSDGFPVVYGNDNVHVDTDEEFPLKIGGFFSMSIEEYEMLVRAISYNGTAPFPYIFELLRNSTDHTSIKNFINRTVKLYSPYSKKFDDMIFSSQSQVAAYIAMRQ